MRGFEDRLKDFDARGIRVVGISVDSPEVTRRHAAKQGYTFLFLSDENAQVIRRYDLLHLRAGRGGHDISRPAEFLLDSNGVVRWVNLTGDVRVRARPEQVFEAAEHLGLSPPPGK